MSACPNDTLSAPFPYFGGKSRIAEQVWSRFGANVPNLVEPFFGSGAVLLARPGGAGAIETVNDADGLLCNFWRAVQHDPDAVAHHADWPVNECDLTARHIWLVQRRESLTERLMTDPDWYDAKAAGWWCWGICCWIGAGWCSGDGPWTVVDGQLVKMERDGGRGVNRTIVHLGDAGVGVNRKRVHLGNAGPNKILRRDSAGILDWFTRLSERLHRVRVCCGDWARVCGPTPTVKNGLTAVFLDPPYGEGRDEGLYAEDSLTVAEDVRRWALEWGDDPRMRIALCGYDDLEMPSRWERMRWKAKGGYGSQGDGTGRENARREVVWFSPHCLKPTLQGVLPLEIGAGE